jgi:hypothetical protein
MKKLKLWWISTFKVISNEKALEMGLTHYHNIYGDAINHLNCRSIWLDSEGRKYRVERLA